MRVPRGGLGSALAALALLAAACAEAPELPRLASRVDVDTPELRAAKRATGVEPCPAGATEPADGPLPDVTLACLGGGDPVNLSALDGPALVSFWASWCTSCPDELPLFQRLHEEAGDRVRVIGVDYVDTQPGRAMTLLAETGATYPQLADPGGDLADAYRLNYLPALILVDAEGEVAFRTLVVESYDQLRDLVAEHAGVDW